MLSEAIRQCIREKWTTEQELAELAGISDSAVSRYLTDQAQPRFESVRQWVRHHPNRRVRLVFVECLVRGTPITLSYCDRNLDVDGDGRVSARDAVRAMHMALACLSDELSRLDRALADERVTDGELQSLSQQGQAAIDAIQKGLGVLERLNEHDHRRRPARPALAE